MRTLLFLALLAAPPLANTAVAKTSFRFAGSTVELLNSAEAAPLNGASDAYTKALTPFDLSIRLDKPTGATEIDYLRRAAAAVHNWPAAEATELENAFKAVETYVVSQKLKLGLPRVIQMIKTDGSEEFGAEGYTRGARIMLNTAAQPVTAHLVAHELFHVISRANPALRDRVYAVFGFQPCNPIDLATALNGRGITNPDCPVVEHSVELPFAGRQVPFALVLYSKKTFQSGAGLGEYAALGLIALKGDGKDKEPLVTDGAFVVHELGEMPEFFKKVGTNTQYLLHPEEISAEHFAMLVVGEKVREQKYLDGVKAALSNP